MLLRGVLGWMADFGVWMSVKADGSPRPPTLLTGGLYSAAQPAAIQIHYHTNR